MSHANRAQFQTPPWAAEELVNQFFPGLGRGDRVLEPSCGIGGMLGAIPAAAEAIGVEIDPALAAEARGRTGRPVICGDFSRVELPWAPTAVFGNPPFEMDLIERWLARFAREMPDGGRCGLILPAYAVQTPDRVVRWAQSWSIESHHLPRTLFPGLQAPVIFAMFRKDRLRLLRGFALYRKASAVGAMGARGRLMLAREGATWRDVVAAALGALGGEASLESIYAAAGAPDGSRNRWPRAKIRQTLQRGAGGRFARTSRGRWALIGDHGDVPVAGGPALAGLWS